MTQSPYSRFKARSIIWWQITGLIVFTILLALVKDFVQLDEETDSNLLLIAIYLCESGWIYYVSKKAGIDVWELIRKGERVNPYLLFGLVPLLVLLSIGVGLLLGYVLSYTFPSLLTSDWFQGKSYPSSSTYPVLNRVLDILSTLLFAPIVEEVIFRGMFLNRWTTKWNIRRAILLSSFFFATLHPWVNASSFVFGLCMCLLYLKSRTLFIPILAHVLNNAIALMFELFIPGSEITTENAVEEYRSWVWLGIVCLAISLPPILLFIYRNYPAKDETTPHTIAKESEPPEPIEFATTTNTPYG
jgi:uncharacterized protein